MAASMFSYSVERCDKLTSPPFTFNFMESPGILLLYTLTKLNMLRAVCDITKEINSCIRRKYTLIIFHLQTYTVHAFMDYITDWPYYLFRSAIDTAVITVSVKVFDSIAVFKVMIKISG